VQIFEMGLQIRVDDRRASPCLTVTADPARLNIA